MSEKSKAEPASNVVNSLRALRMAKGLLKASSPTAP